MNYYNEIDVRAAAWLRELIKSGELPEGHIDTRSITEIKPDELTKYTQCHFFAGIGGWSYALRLAGWPEDSPVWTGSCPCQPFSCAGKGLGAADERHLWPVFGELIRQCRPTICFGEQVASKSGRLWLAGIRTDLENMGYAVGGSDLCAACVGAPHIRQRLYWVANYKGEGRSGMGPECAAGERQRTRLGSSGSVSGMGESDGTGRNAWQSSSTTAGHRRPAESAGGVGAWSDFELVHCRDGKSRRIESGTFPLAHGVPGRVGLLRGYGNAIVPQLAAEFIRASQEAIEEIS